ncbi:MAG: hypothetical protein RBG13Loki_1469 [Promethearchaeota archaeon CR_4]|nr:MAG: hypothetical protein RBG13Loki_1469 [Candidatus Lokiarchaeota archaeon CR_4]
MEVKLLEVKEYERKLAELRAIAAKVKELTRERLELAEKLGIQSSEYG